MKNGVLKILKETDKFAFEKQGNYDNELWGLVYNDCDIQFFKRLVPGDGSVSFFTIIKNKIENGRLIEVERKDLDTSIITVSSNFLYSNFTDCPLASLGVGLYYYLFDSGINRYKSELMQFPSTGNEEGIINLLGLQDDINFFLQSDAGDTISIDF